jgi:uncharacterized membrane protein YbaN (DUF454 family)
VEFLPLQDTSRDSLSTPGSQTDPGQSSGRLRIVFLVLGWLFVGLAGVGVLLPVIPTTPFLLVAAACFARSSPRFYNWLVQSRMFGPAIRRWRETHTISRRVKVSAILALGVVGGSSALFFVSNPWARIVLVLLLIAVAIWILRIPSTQTSGVGRVSDGSREVGADPLDPMGGGA